MNSLSIAIAENLKEPPVWVVKGVNWHIDVPMNEVNAELEEEHQVYEAASVALMVFKGHDRGIYIVMDEGETAPLLDTTMLVYRRGTDPAKKGFLPFTHEILANQGFYKESVQMLAQLETELEEVKQGQERHEDSLARVEHQIKKLKIEPIKIGKDGRCQCHCGMTCPLGRSGMELRCTRDELQSAGIPTTETP